MEAEEVERATLDQNSFTHQSRNVEFEHFLQKVRVGECCGLERAALVRDAQQLHLLHGRHVHHVTDSEWKTAVYHGQFELDAKVNEVFVLQVAACSVVR